MSCYLRHMHWLFEALSLPYEKTERKRVDTALRAVLGLPPGTPCPEVWAAIKALPDEERANLAPRVRGELDS